MRVEWWSATSGIELLLLGLSLLCSLVIGLERQFRHKSAGVRTHVLVALGAAAFTLISAFGFPGVLGQDVTLDPSRIAAQIVSGVGFLGGGVIFMRRNMVHGLTTAAGIWVSAAVGMACGAGMPTLAVGVTGSHLLVMSAVAPLVRLLPQQDRKRLISVTYLDGRGALRDILMVAAESGVAYTVQQTTVNQSVSPRTVMVVLEAQGGPALADMMFALSELDDLVDVRRISREDAEENE